MESNSLAGQPADSRRHIEGGDQASDHRQPFVPVVAGSAYRFVGVQPLLDAVIDYLPGPLDSKSVVADFGSAVEGVIESKYTEPSAALVFKLVHDAQGRRMVLLRVYSGWLSKGDRVLNVRTGRRERIGRLMRVFATAARTWKPLGRATLSRPWGWKESAPATPRAYGRTDPSGTSSVPEPVVSMALEPRLDRDRDRLATALCVSSDEDPTFRTLPIRRRASGPCRYG